MRSARLLILAAFTGGLLSGCGPDELVEESVLRPVRYEEIVATGGGRVRSFSGAAQSGMESRLSFRVAGRPGTAAMLDA